MRKRVAIARALVSEPQVILYDEPTSELDPLMAVTIGEEILSLKNRIDVTSIVVTHDRDLAFGLADRVAMVMDGQIQALGTPDEIRAHPDPGVQRFLKINFNRNGTEATS
jgi:phospholipid/cholesterol/gamma-HCH transport system ATP-binding protein